MATKNAKNTNTRNVIVNKPEVVGKFDGTLKGFTAVVKGKETTCPVCGEKAMGETLPLSQEGVGFLTKENINQFDNTKGWVAACRNCAGPVLTVEAVS